MNLNDKNVPIVGQPFQILGWYANALVACKCIPNGQTIIILNANHVTICSQCKRGYQIAGVNHEGNITVNMLLPASGNGSGQPPL